MPRSPDRGWTQLWDAFTCSKLHATYPTLQSFTTPPTLLTTRTSKSGARGPWAGRVTARPPAPMGDCRPVLVTGGAGVIGSNIAARLAESGSDVIVYDSLARPGVERNLEWLQWRHGKRIMPVLGDIRDAPLLADAVKQASAVFHMAAQVAVTTSLDDPRGDFEVNAIGTLNLMERSEEHTSELQSLMRR